MATRSPSYRTAAAVLALVAALSTTAPASAAEADLLVSRDGVHYGTAEVLPIIPDDLRLVPGDTETVAFWVRNASGTAGLLRLDLLDPVSADPDFATRLELSATPQGAPSAPVSLAAGIAQGACTVLSGTRVLAPGETVRIDVTATLGAGLTGGQGARGTADFRMRAVLADAGAAAVQQPGSACAAPPASGSESGASSPAPQAPGELAITGGSLPLTAAVVGALGVLAGLAAFLWARRREARGDRG
ncbi:hypothetical protein L2X99_00645 [Microbacterium sp. KUDC0406]|uniref:hypothetical protein n=1 Tax=Microbacterium sp. KUDC0406 TaxID=2909588 RepID=UPI001F46FDE2|nr:hypothetical protein [Microbacterium sp. KUDC0406]UJP10266.1 hypothetical protein L2X99_00645 [Microbacterium sp. KUDC0406]